MLVASVAVGAPAAAEQRLTRSDCGDAGPADAEVLMRARMGWLVCVGVVLGLLAGCGGGDGDDGPGATVAAADPDPTTTSTTEARTPEEEAVEAAYLKSWDVYAEAVRELDDSRLDEVFEGDALVLKRQEIADYRLANTPGIIEVDHDYEISILEPGRAVVLDEYVNHSVFIDPISEEPTEEDPNEVLRQRSELRESEGAWRVVYAAELSSPSASARLSTPRRGGRA